MKKEIRKPRRKFTAPKVCYFCSEKKEPSFWDAGAFQKFITERGKIVPRMRNGLCSKHQKKLTVEVKRARYLALVPFISR